MTKRICKSFSLGICLLFFTALTAWSQDAVVKSMTNDTVLRVLYYGGLKGNIAPCG